MIAGIGTHAAIASDALTPEETVKADVDTSDKARRLRVRITLI